jgi:hypothetical protein
MFALHVKPKTQNKLLLEKQQIIIKLKKSLNFCELRQLLRSETIAT